MVKRVLIIASGPTELNALPELLKHLETEDIRLDVRVPPGHQQIRPSVVCPIIYAAQYDSQSGPPDKCVILMDTDGKSPEETIAPIRQGLQQTRVLQVVQSVKYAYAQWHLEAWYFADTRNLRSYLGRDVGNINPNEPDRIENPKLHLQQLLGELTYTAQVSGAIARQLDYRAIAQRSPSFRNFLATVKNGVEA
jgi:hypothetical protein